MRPIIFLLLSLAVTFSADAQLQQIITTSPGSTAREAYRISNENDVYINNRVDSLRDNLGGGGGAELIVESDGTQEAKVEIRSSITGNPDNKAELLIGNLDDGLGGFIPSFRLGVYRTPLAQSFLFASDENFQLGSTDGINSSTFRVGASGFSFDSPVTFNGSAPSTDNILNIPTGASAFKIQTSTGGTFMRWDMNTNAENIVFGKTTALSNRQLVLKYTHQPSLAGTRFDALSIPTKQYVDDQAVTGGDGMTKSGSSLNLGGTVNGNVTLAPGTIGTGVFQIGNLFGNRFDRIYHNANRMHFYVNGPLSDHDQAFQVTGNNGLMLALNRDAAMNITTTGSEFRVEDANSNQFMLTMDEVNRTFSTWVSNGVNTTRIEQTPSEIAFVGKTELTNIPTNDDALTQILARDATTGEIKYRSAASLAGGGGGGWATTGNTSLTGNAWVFLPSAGTGEFSFINEGEEKLMTLTEQSVFIGNDNSSLGLSISPANGIVWSGLTQDDTKSQVLVKDGTSNKMFWRDASSLGGGGGVQPDGATLLGPAPTWTVPAEGILTMTTTPGSVQSIVGIATSSFNTMMYLNETGTSEVLHLQGGVADGSNIQSLVFDPTGSEGTPGVVFTDGGGMLGGIQYGGTGYVKGPQYLADAEYVNNKTIEGSGALDFPLVAAGAEASLTLTVTGATGGDPISLGLLSGAMQPGLIWQAYVSAPNTVTVKVNNVGSAPQDVLPTNFKVTIFKP